MIKDYSEPKICTRRGNLVKRWYVEFYCLNPETKTPVRYQYMCGVNRLHTKRERLKELNAWRESYSDLLFSGWRPFSNEGLGLAAIAANKLPVALDMAFSEVMKQKARKSPETVRSYKSIVKLFQDWIETAFPAGTADLALIDKNRFRAYSQYMLSKRRYGPKTHNNHINVLGTFWKEFIDMELVTANPAQAVKMLPVDKVSQVHRAYDPGTAARISAYLVKNDPQLLLFQKCIFYFAIRPKELRNIKIKDIDLLRNTVTVSGGISKNHQTRTIAIPEPFISDINALNLGQYSPETYLFSPGRRPGPVIYSKDAMNKRFRKVKELLNIPACYTNYGFKHTAADALFDLPGIPEQAIQAHFRHSSLDQTKQYARNRGKRLNPELTANYPKFAGPEIPD